MTRTDGALMALALVAGAVLPLQALINGRLGDGLGSPLWGGLAQNLVGTTVVALVVLALRTPAPAAAQLAAVPAWSWVGGVLGALYVLVALLAAPRLGATRAMTVIIAGQLAASVLLDQFGVLHPRRPATLETLGGLGLLAAGAFLVLRKA
ncbi:MAG TPA: DMT family transporter [Caulobacteraceae bacterium]|nr:DMT family transporter [Caulobacteraceae bacterium]